MNKMLLVVFFPLLSIKPAWADANVSCSLFKDEGDRAAKIVSDEPPYSKIRRLQMRQAVAAWHYKVDTQDYTDEEFRELTDGVFFETWSLAGHSYHVVVVGFGGGNHASYLFLRGSSAFAGVMLIDGVDCYERGEIARFKRST